MCILMGKRLAVFLNSFFLLQSFFGLKNVNDFNKINLFLTAILLKQGYKYHIVRKSFSKFYHNSSDLIVNYKIKR